MKKSFWIYLYTCFILMFTIYTLLDTFVLTKAYQSVTNATTNQVVTNATTTSSSYQDDNIQITITTDRAYSSNIYIADIVLSSSQYLKTALADNTYGKNIKDTTSNIAQSNQAILAINGDFYGARNAGYVI